MYIHANIKPCSMTGIGPTAWNRNDPPVSVHHVPHHHGSHKPEEDPQTTIYVVRSKQAECCAV